MPGLMIIAHAPLASSLRAVAQHAFPDCAARLAALDVTPEMSVEDVEAEARAMLARVREPEALILTDVLGATPCNVAQRLADGRQVRVVAGVNVPMLWRSLCYQGESVDAVADRAASGGVAGVLQVGALKPQNQNRKATAPDDPTKHHDQ